MADNPLQRRMAEQGQVPAARGITQDDAADKIMAMLDDDGRTPGHKDTLDGVDERGQNNEPERRAPEEDPVEEQDQDIDDGDTAEAEGDDDDTDAEVTEDQAVDEDEESGAIETLTQLAEAMEMDPEDLFATLQHTVKAAGEEHTVTLADLVTGFQLRADYDRGKTALAEQRRIFETEQTERVDSFKQNSSVLAQQFSLVEQALAARLQDPNLVAMRQNGQEAEYLLQVRDIETQINNLRGARQQAAQQYEQFMQQERLAFMEQEGSILRNEVPDWGDEKLQSAVDTIKTLGFDDREVVNVIDSRFIKGALELASLRSENAALKARIETGEKAAVKVKKTVPKSIKPGKQAQKRGRGPDRNRVSKLRRRLAQTNHINDAASLIESMME